MKCPNCGAEMVQVRECYVGVHLEECPVETEDDKGCEAEHHRAEFTCAACEVGVHVEHEPCGRTD